MQRFLFVPLLLAGILLGPVISRADIASNLNVCDDPQ
jgi:hypothetical protein